MTRQEKALKYFADGFHCSQAVFASFADRCGITEEQALRIGACFGSGMRKGEVCGACSGALMVLGSLYGQHDLSDTESRQVANEVNDRMGYDISTPEGRESARKKNLFRELCPQMVANAVAVLEEIIRERQQDE